MARETMDKAVTYQTELENAKLSGQRQVTYAWSDLAGVTIDRSNTRALNPFTTSGVLCQAMTSRRSRPSFSGNYRQCSENSWKSYPVLSPHAGVDAKAVFPYTAPNGKRLLFP